MDPIANLKEQLDLAKAIINAWDDCDEEGNLTQTMLEKVGSDAERLADLVIALDEWQRKGGFSPYAKVPKTQPNKQYVACEHCGYKVAGNPPDICPDCEAGDPTNVIRAAWVRL